MSINGLLLLALALTAFCTLIMVSVVIRTLFNEILGWVKHRRKSRTKDGLEVLQDGRANPG